MTSISTKGYDQSEVRRQVQDQRGKLTGDEVLDLSQDIVQKFIQAFESFYPLAGLQFALYKSFGNELNLDALDAYLRKVGADVFYPKLTDPEERTMEMVPATMEASEWSKGTLGFLEPAGPRQGTDPSELDVIIVPSVAVGGKGERVGMGVGFYDRYLPRAKTALRISLVYNFQVRDDIRENPWDQKMNWIFSQDQDIRVSGTQDWVKRRSN